MSKLPKIFHNDNKFYTNNKNSFNTFEKRVENNIEEQKKKYNSIDIDGIVTYFNKKIVITLKDGKVYSGVLISKRNNKLLLDTNDYILIDDIISIE